MSTIYTWHVPLYTDMKWGFSWNYINGHATGTDSLEVPTIYKAYFLGLCFREYPHNSYGQNYGTNVPPFQDPEILIDQL